MFPESLCLSIDSVSLHWRSNNSLDSIHWAHFDALCLSQASLKVSWSVRSILERMGCDNYPTSAQLRVCMRIFVCVAALMCFLQLGTWEVQECGDREGL